MHTNDDSSSLHDRYRVAEIDVIEMFTKRSCRAQNELLFFILFYFKDFLHFKLPQIKYQHVCQSMKVL